MFNENHFLDASGLSHTTEDDLRRCLTEEINEFLKTQTYIPKKESKAALKQVSQQNKIKKFSPYIISKDPHSSLSNASSHRNSEDQKQLLPQSNSDSKP
jgi:hypothetical protein